MRQLNKDFVQICMRHFNILEPIYEFGTYQHAPNVDMRPIFPGKKYIGADMRSGPGVDVILDVQKIDLGPEVAGTVLMLDTMEHIEYLRETVKEIYRILKIGGIFINISVMYYPIHPSPKDYWRFTPQAFESLLKDFETSFVGYAGHDDFPHTIAGIGIKGRNTISNEFIKEYNDWRVKYPELVYHS